MATIVRCYPCADCPDSACEGETGTQYCKADPNGDPCCESYRYTITLEEWAEAVILIIRSSRAHFADTDLASDFAERQADLFDEMFAEQDAEFARDEFVHRCGYDVRKARP
jgi:hypothetical protein